MQNERTAMQAIAELNKIEDGITSEVMFMNGKYMSIYKYVMTYFEQYRSMFDDMSAFVPRFKSRIEEAKAKYAKEFDIICEEKLNALFAGDERGAAFIAHLKNLPVGSVTSSGIVHGDEVVPFEEEFAVYNHSVNEPTPEEIDFTVKQGIVGNVLYQYMRDNSFDESAIIGNDAFISHLFGDFITSIDFDKEKAEGTLEQTILAEISKSLIKKDDRTEVEKIEEMEVVGNTVTTPSTSMLTKSEIDALSQGLERKIATPSPVIVASGGDEEEEETIEEPEVIATMEMDPATEITGVTRK